MFVKVILFLIIRLTFVKANDLLVEGDRSFSELDKVEVLEGASAKLTCTSGMATRFCMFSGPSFLHLVVRFDNLTPSFFGRLSLSSVCEVPRMHFLFMKIYGIFIICNIFIAFFVFQLIYTEAYAGQPHHSHHN